MAGYHGWLAVDRLGKGLRTAPRDALISLSVEPERLGLAFGVHRAMDAMGAMLGPILAFVILMIIRDGYRVVFVASFFVAVIGLAVLGFFVENRSSQTPTREVRESDVPRPWTFLRNPGFRHLTVSTLLLSFMTVSDAFVYLILQLRTGIPIAGFPLLYVGTSAAYLLLAVPVGHLADRVGRFPIFIAGYAVLILLYAALLSPYRGAWLPVAILALLGLYYAATEGVLMALGSSLVVSDVRAGGLAVLTTATAMARLASSVAVGFAWTYLGLEATLLVFGAGLMIAVAISWLVMPGASNQTASA